uniref:EF-hand domain-containing protein n=2 Tax=Scleropages formosus TaxID=113540 RepID=A0A8C9RMH3_SCLFO
VCECVCVCVCICISVCLSSPFLPVCLSVGTRPEELWREVEGIRKLRKKFLGTLVWRLPSSQGGSGTQERHRKIQKDTKRYNKDTKKKQDRYSKDTKRQKKEDQRLETGSSQLFKDKRLLVPGPSQWNKHMEAGFGGMKKMESAISTIVKVYMKSSKGKGSLGDKDFQKLVKSQLSNIMMGTENSEAIKEMRKGLDANQDNKVSFEEFMQLMGYLANALSQQRTLGKEAVQEEEQEAAP